MSSVKISYGLENSVTKPLSQYPTVASILADSNLQAFLGFGANVEALVNDVAGVQQIQDGDEITIRDRANTKGC